MAPAVTIAPAVEAFLNRPLHAVLATHATDGSISQSVVWFARAGLTFWMSVRPDSVKARHVGRDPRVSVLVLAPHGGAYVRIEGRATIDEVVTDDLRLDLVTLYQGADAAQWVREHPLPTLNTLLRVYPERIVSVGV